MKTIINFLRKYAWGVIAVCVLVASSCCLAANWIDGLEYAATVIIIIPVVYLLVAIGGMLWNLVKKIWS